MKPNNLRTVKQVAATIPVFTEATLRWLIFNAATNDFDRVLVKVGRRVYIDLDELAIWLESKRVSADSGLRSA